MLNLHILSRTRLTWVSRSSLTIIRSRTDRAGEGTLFRALTRPPIRSAAISPHRGRAWSGVASAGDFCALLAAFSCAAPHGPTTGFLHRRSARPRREAGGGGVGTPDSRLCCCSSAIRNDARSCNSPEPHKADERSDSLSSMRDTVVYLIVFVATPLNARITARTPRHPNMIAKILACELASICGPRTYRFASTRYSSRVIADSSGFTDTL